MKKYETKQFKEYDVYFLDDYMGTFKTKKDAQKFINDCVKFDKENDNPFGADKQNYSIEINIF